MKKRILIILVVLVVAFLAIGSIFGYQMYRKYGLGEVPLDAVESVIPEPPGSLPPLSEGTSDWLSWRGPGMVGKSDLTGMVTDWSNGLPERWAVDYLCRGEEAVVYSGPAIRGNRLVVMGRDHDMDQVFCLHAETGKLLWHRAYEAPTDPKFGTGSRATPFIDGDRVYTFGRAGHLACWELYDGTEVWRRNVTDEGGKEPNWGHSSSPLVLGGMVIVQGGGEARLIAYDKVTGEVRWKSGRGEAGYATVMPIMLDGKTHLLQFHGTGLALADTLDGKIYWDIPWETEYGVNAATPIVRSDTVFITSGYGMGSLCLKVSKEGTTEIWKSKVIASQLSDLVLIGDYLYGYTANANNSGPFKCVRLSDGEELWSTKKIGGGSLVSADGHLLCFDVKGNLHLVRPEPAEFDYAGSLNGAVDGVDHESWTPPAIANGRLYLRYLNKLVCYSLKR